MLINLSCFGNPIPRTTADPRRHSLSACCSAEHVSSVFGSQLRQQPSPWSAAVSWANTRKAAGLKGPGDKDPEGWGLSALSKLDPRPMVNKQSVWEMPSSNQVVNKRLRQSV